MSMRSHSRSMSEISCCKCESDSISRRLIAVIIADWPVSAFSIAAMRTDTLLSIVRSNLVKVLSTDSSISA
jgi:hypothetical protein